MRFITVDRDTTGTLDDVIAPASGRRVKILACMVTGRLDSITPGHELIGKISFSSPNEFNVRSHLPLPHSGAVWLITSDLALIGDVDATVNASCTIEAGQTGKVTWHIWYEITDEVPADPYDP